MTTSPRPIPISSGRSSPARGNSIRGLPHGAYLTTYVSKAALKAIQDKEGSYPNNAFIVKENYSPEKKLGAVTVMYRVKGYNADAGDWFWAKYAADGSIEKEGKVGGCINCHTSRIMDDWVFSGSVKQAGKVEFQDLEFGAPAGALTF